MPPTADGADMAAEPASTPTSRSIEALDLEAIYLARRARVRAEMARRDIGACLLTDAVNIRYATGTRNMQVFSSRNPASRYLFLPVEGPVVLFEFAGAEHLPVGAATIDEVRTATTSSYVSKAERQDETIGAWADEIADLMRRHGGGSRRLGLEAPNAGAAFALANRGLEVVDAQAPVERARAIKVPGEIDLVRSSVDATMAGVRRLEAALRPGITEAELWAELWHHVIATGADYIETRLLNSGARTNPWYQETSGKPIAAGELVALDTDVVGCHGYYADFSRTFLCGDGRPTDAQHTLYGLAWEQIHHNMELIKPGVTFAELSEKGWNIPEPYVAHRYYLLAHGCGMTGEYPYILHGLDYPGVGYDGVVEPNMVLCIEAFLGRADGGEGVKLEQQVLVTETGWDLLSDYGFDERLLG